MEDIFNKYKLQDKQVYGYRASDFDSVGGAMSGGGALTLLSSNFDCPQRLDSLLDYMYAMQDALSIVDAKYSVAIVMLYEGDFYSVDEIAGLVSTGAQTLSDLDSSYCSSDSTNNCRLRFNSAFGQWQVHSNRGGYPQSFPSQIQAIDHALSY